jgi:hypothetical protein
MPVSRLDLKSSAKKPLKVTTHFNEQIIERRWLGTAAVSLTGGDLLPI